MPRVAATCSPRAAEDAVAGHDSFQNKCARTHDKVQDLVVRSHARQGPGDPTPLSRRLGADVNRCAMPPSSTLSNATIPTFRYVPGASHAQAQGRSISWAEGVRPGQLAQPSSSQHIKGNLLSPHQRQSLSKSRRAVELIAGMARVVGSPVVAIARVATGYDFKELASAFIVIISFADAQIMGRLGITQAKVDARSNSALQAVAGTARVLASPAVAVARLATAYDFSELTSAYALAEMGQASSAQDQAPVQPLSQSLSQSTNRSQTQTAPHIRTSGPMVKSNVVPFVYIGPVNPFTYHASRRSQQRHADRKIN